MGELGSEDGEVRKSAKLRVGYFAQHQTEARDLNETPIQALGRVMPSGSTKTQIRSRLGALVFRIILTRIGDLSGGQKARSMLALTSFDRPHILLLDEPTNHLDMDSRQALVES